VHVDQSYFFAHARLMSLSSYSAVSVYLHQPKKYLIIAPLVSSHNHLNHRVHILNNATLPVYLALNAGSNLVLRGARLAVALVLAVLLVKHFVGLFPADAHEEAISGESFVEHLAFQCLKESLTEKSRFCFGKKHRLEMMVLDVAELGK